MLISITPSFADIGPFSVDVFGAYVDAGDLKKQLGFGGGLGLGITDTVSVQFRFTASEKTENANKYYEEHYKHNTILLGVEYVPVIPFLERYHLSWNTSLFLGMSSSEYDYTTVAWIEDHGQDDGFSGLICTGPHFNLTQYVSFFAEIGFHYSYFSGELQDESVYGIQAIAGARCTLFGCRDYAKGY